MISFSRIPHYIKKTWEYGPLKTVGIVRQRVSTSWYQRKIRKQAVDGTAHYIWEQIASRHNLGLFEHEWKRISTLSLPYLDALYDRPAGLIEQADAYVNKTFDLLGSGPLTFDRIPWHDDFRLQNQSPGSDVTFDSSVFYRDIIITSGTTETLCKDIKIPWELSRLQHLLVLGLAYRETGEQRYVDAFQEHASDWIERNPYLLGPNWICPMDVGIRAYNMIVGVHFFKDVTSIPGSFWQTLVESLYNHMLYLEHNWEVYDGRTSNHYLSDLVGYLSLCWFFNLWPGVDQKLSWVTKEIETEFEKQVFDEGADYEGSTAYHGLVTELFYHAGLLLQESSIQLSLSFEKKLRRMFDFMVWCPASLIQIGDDDSGKLLHYGITDKILQAMQSNEKKYGTKLYRQFGVSVIKTEHLHVSLRHHAYQSQQPSGHFHNDMGSITLAVDDEPFIVDPGSYLYTPSGIWRNRFRSVTVHNTFWKTGEEPVPFDERLFALTLPERTVGVTDVLQTSWMSGSRRATRTLVCDGQSLNIVDQWTGDDAVDTTWNFIIGPSVMASRDGNLIILQSNISGAKVALHVEGDTEIVDAWYAQKYGSKMRCAAICGRSVCQTLLFRFLWM
ncbi:heparinase II/III family protein [Candidatus Babeliales bacterium]|nr:heparinase II/III family protein [Candidatus Babeliales bacterium]